MALINCPECNKEFSDQADACPNCGYKPIQEEKKELLEKKNKTKKNAGVGCLVLIIVVILAVYLLIPERDPDAWKKEDNSFAAYIMTEDWVKERLKSPSTAKFPDEKNEHTFKIDAHRYKIISYVDAQNSFGASIRTKFIAEVEQVNENKWILISLEIIE